jgi:hypothetical protein
MSENHFDNYGSRDLWPSDPKINKGHLLVMTDQYVKYKNFVKTVYKIISGNYVVHRRTDRRTLAKQYTPSYSKGTYKVMS